VSISLLVDAREIRLWASVLTTTFVAFLAIPYRVCHHTGKRDNGYRVPKIATVQIINSQIKKIEDLYNQSDNLFITSQPFTNYIHRQQRT
jgi:hypothetical protein